MLTEDRQTLLLAVGVWLVVATILGVIIGKIINLGNDDD